MKILVRVAHPGDAEAAAELMRRSITELCVADHGNDPAIVAKWLENKTAPVFEAWVDNPRNTIVVAEVDGALAAVGGSRGAEIILNYVHPDFRFQGASKAVLKWLEGMLRMTGALTVKVVSTKTAHKFYLDRGYVDDGAPVAGPAGLEQPMTRRFVETASVRRPLG